MALVEHGLQEVPQTAPEIGGDIPLDEIIKGIKKTRVVYLASPEDAQALRDPDTRAVAELFSRFVHPVNRKVTTYTERIPIPPAWNYPDQEQVFGRGRLGTKSMYGSGHYERDGDTFRGAISWSMVFVAPGDPPRHEIFRAANITNNVLKLTELEPDPRKYENGIASVVLPTQGSRLDIVGVSQMPNLPLAGNIARGLLEARIFAPKKARPRLARSA